MSVDKTTSDDVKHFGDVTSICYYNEHLFSAGSDGKIKVWKFSRKNFEIKFSFV